MSTRHSPAQDVGIDDINDAEKNVEESFVETELDPVRDHSQLMSVGHFDPSPFQRKCPQKMSTRQLMSAN